MRTWTLGRCCLLYNENKCTAFTVQWNPSKWIQLLFYEKHWTRFPYQDLPYDNSVAYSKLLSHIPLAEVLFLFLLSLWFNRISLLCMKTLQFLTRCNSNASHAILIELKEKFLCWRHYKRYYGWHVSVCVIYIKSLSS